MSWRDPLLPPIHDWAASNPTLRVKPRLVELQVKPQVLAKTVRIVGPDNGRGLLRSRAIIAEAFRKVGWDVCVFDSQREKANNLAYTPANVHLEVFATHIIDRAAVNVVIPNPEWWDTVWTSSLLHPSTKVWAKTEDSARIFSNLGARVEYLGFRSRDRRDQLVVRERAFLHVSGGSFNKRAATLTSCWQADWPRLTLVDAPPWLTSPHPNVTFLPHVSDEELCVLQNSHAFHIYPSVYEGFGHSIWEGLSCGALVFATNGPPFNEHPEAFHLLGVKAGILLNRGTPRQVIVGNEVDEHAIEGAVASVISLSDEALEEACKTSRKTWETATAAFDVRLHQNVVSLVASLGSE